MEDEDPLWRQILTNEIFWVAVAALLILTVAFFLATSPPAEPVR